MARDGSGNYSNPYPNFVSGTVISSAEVDANNSNVATALTQSIAVDGQSTVTANLPMNSKKLTGLVAGTAAADSLSLGQAQAEAMVWCGTAGGTADAITLAPSPAITAYAAGQRFVWKASGSVNTGATTVAISGLGAIALQDNGAALVAGNHAASKIFMGILDTTSTVQVMQVQISGTDPLIVTSLTVSGTSLLTGVTTHGDDVVSDTDSTDDLGTTGVRWANLYVDAITATDQVTATGFTGTLDGILGSGTPAAATVTTIDASGVATATTFEPDGDTSAGDNAALGYTSVLGAILTGQGSTNDVTLVNDADATVLGIPTGTTNVAVTGDLTANNFAGRNKIIGGDFTTNPWQRGTSFAAIASDSYFADRCNVGYASTAVVTASKAADAPTAAQAGIFTQHCISLAVTTADTSIAAGDVFVLRQTVEGLNAASFGFGQSGSRNVTLSFWVKGTKTGVHCVALINSANNRSYVAEYTIASTNTWEYNTITIPVDTTGTWLYDTGAGVKLHFALMSGSTYQTSADTWAAGNFFATSNQVNALDSTSNTFKIALVQLEAGSVATTFDARSVGTELALCQRYLQSSWSQGSAIGSAVSSTANSVQMSWGSSNSGSIAGQAFILPVAMRTSPTLVLYDLALATGKVTTQDAGANLVNNVAANLAATNTNSFIVRMYANSVYGMVFAYTLSAEL